MKNLTLSAILGILFVLPMMIMEWVNRREYAEDYPFPVFFVLWLLAVTFILIFLSVIHDIKAGAGFFRNPLVLIKTILLITFAGLLMGIVIDQMPCFLGVPHCD
jgi:hypothetical protein